MTHLDRRQFLHTAGAVGAAAGLGTLLFDREAAAAIGDTLTIAYHVPLPAWGPHDGPVLGQPSAHVDLQMRFRPVCRPERRSELPARPAHEMGLDRR